MPCQTTKVPSAIRPCPSLPTMAFLHTVSGPDPRSRFLFHSHHSVLCLLKHKPSTPGRWSDVLTDSPVSARSFPSSSSIRHLVFTPSQLFPLQELPSNLDKPERREEKASLSLPPFTCLCTSLFGLRGTPVLWL